MIFENNRLITENISFIENIGILSIPRIILWWDANSFAQPDGTRIENLIDRAGSGFNLQQFMINRQPRIKTNGLNGNRTIVFDVSSTGTLLSSKAGLSSIVNNRIIEIFQVSQIKNTPSTFLYWHFRAMNNPSLIITNQTTANEFLIGVTNDFGQTSTLTVPTSLNNNQFYIFYSRFDFTSTDVDMFAEVVGIDSISGTGTGSFTFNVHTFRVGSENNPVEMEQAEIIVFSNTQQLSNTNKLSVINYLQNKYNI